METYTASEFITVLNFAMFLEFVEDILINI